MLQVAHRQLTDVGDHDPATDRTSLLVGTTLTIDAVLHQVAANLAARGDQESTRREDDVPRLLDGLEVATTAEECPPRDEVSNDLLLGGLQAVFGHLLGQFPEQQHGLHQRVVLHSTQRDFSFVFKLQFYRSGWLWTRGASSVFQGSTSQIKDNCTTFNLGSQLDYFMARNLMIIADKIIDDFQCFWQDRVFQDSLLILREAAKYKVSISHAGS